MMDMLPQRAVPPRMAEKLLHLLAPPAGREWIMGDFREEFAEGVGENGRFRATIWYWQQLFRSAPALYRLKLIHQYERRWLPMMTTLSKRDKQFLFLGVLLLIPAMLIGIPGILFSAFGLAGPMNGIIGFLESSPLLAWLIHPVLIMGGLAVAFLLNALPVFQFSLSNQEDRFVGMIAIRKGRLLHLTVIGVVAFFALLIVTYLLAENLGFFQLFAV